MTLQQARLNTTDLEWMLDDREILIMFSEARYERRRSRSFLLK